MRNVQLRWFAVSDPSTSEPLGLRERKKLATARALERAALQLVDEHGLDAVTVEEIAAAADVSPRTFFNYFSSKEDALVGGFAAGAQRFADALLARPTAEQPFEAARAVFAARASYLEDRADLYRLRMTVIMRHRELYPRMVGAFGEWERSIGDAVARRTGNDKLADTYPMRAAAIIAGIMRTSMRRWSMSDYQAPLDEIFASAFELVESGMQVPG
jgi:AcrR family transcriptional regulator